MGHIFISYSHNDTEYAHALAADLQSRGFEVWIDERLDYGSQWPHELQKQLDSCSAFLLIMSPRSYASEWVQSELQRAKRKLKPVFPLLLEGDEPWLSVESTQYYDVRGGRFPDTKFYSALGRALLSSGDQSARVPHEGQNAAKLKPAAGAPRLKTGVLVAVGAIALLLIAVIPFLRSNFSNSSELPPGTSSSGNAPDAADFIDSKGVPMRLVPEGKFIMGSEAGYDNEDPVHPVHLSAFYIDKFEVTNASYKACVDEGVCQPPTQTGSFTRPDYFGNSEYDNYPVVYVDWEDANQYCQWRDMSLPTEAQWEKAARGEDARTYPWGENIDETYANYNDELGDTSAVGSYEKGKSPYGVYDMAGNAWEWVADWYSDTYDEGTPLNNPLGPESGRFRVLRGGSWHDDESIVRTANRGWSQLEYFDNTDFGFRCAMAVSP